MSIRFAPDAARRYFTPLDNRFILEYMPHASDPCVKVYLYGLMLCTAGASDESVADALGLSEEAVRDAFVYWQKQGLVRIKGEAPLTVEYLDFGSDESGGVAPGKYASLVSALQSLTAPRTFDFRELRHVYDWVEVYSLDEGAVLELVSHCMDTKGRRVSVNYMGAVAQTWSESGVTTREKARAYIELHELKKHGASAILREWNKTRRPTKAEMALYEKWTGEWGFTQEAILAALPKLTVAGTPNFIYLDELLDALRQKGQITRADAVRADQKEEEERAFAKLVFERAGKIEPATRTQRAQIAMYRGEWNMSCELLLYGAEQCRGANEPFGMMKRLWNEWHEAGVTSVEQAKARADKRPAAKQTRAERAYPQHDMTDEQLAHLLVDLDKEAE